MLQNHKLIGFQGLFPDSKFSVIQSYKLYGARRDWVGEIFQHQ